MNWNNWPNFRVLHRYYLPSDAGEHRAQAYIWIPAPGFNSACELLYMYIKGNGNMGHRKRMRKRLAGNDAHAIGKCVITLRPPTILVTGCDVILHAIAPRVAYLQHIKYFSYICYVIIYLCFIIYVTVCIPWQAVIGWLPVSHQCCIRSEWTTRCSVYQL